MATFKSGIAVIINITEFDPKLHIPCRRGTEVDVSSLYNRCGEIGFKTKLWLNLSVEKMTDKFHKIKRNRDLTNADCLLIVLLTNGKEGHIYATDHAIEMKAIVDQFSSANCPELASKPKIFIFQASKLEDPNQPDSAAYQPDSDDTDISNKTEKGPIAERGEYLVGVPQCLVIKTSSETKKGKTFSRTLADELDRVQNGEDIETILKKIKNVFNDLEIVGRLQRKLVLKHN